MIFYIADFTKVTSLNINVTQDGHRLKNVFTLNLRKILKKLPFKILLEGFRLTPITFIHP